MPSAVGYQPTLGTDVGELQERITSTTEGSITSIQAVYVPADDLTDPAPATTFAHLDGTTLTPHLQPPLPTWTEQQYCLVVWHLCPLGRNNSTVSWFGS